MIKTGDPRRDRQAGVRHNFLGGHCPHPDCGGGTFQPCRFGDRIATCYHIPRCLHEREGFGRYEGTGDVSGYQCAECGHYFPASRVRIDADSEARCRVGMGHEKPGAYRV